MVLILGKGVGRRANLKDRESIPEWLSEIKGNSIYNRRWIQSVEKDCESR